MSIFNHEIKCSLCAKPFKSANGVVFEDGVCICGSCLERIGIAAGFEKTREEKRREEVNRVVSSGMTPKAIKKELDRFVVGQEQAKKVLSVAANNHHKRLVLNDKGIQKSNIMLIGPSGSGKSTTLAALIDKINTGGN